MSNFVSILMGSDSDLQTVTAAKEILLSLEIKTEMHIYSAHRTPQETHDYVKDAEKRGAAVFICCAGLAAHLAGAVAANTIRPVIGLPISSGSLAGFDALLSTVQMPSGVPVATVAIGGAKNAAYLAAQILSLNDQSLQNKLQQLRDNDRKRILAKNAELNNKV